MIGINELLCDDCNLLFKGFAVPGTVSSRSKRKKERRPDTHTSRASR